ncbi:hypothetical protein D7V86_17260 [bacterium D16-51]|nr:hypothetical protein D7V96_16845 [bacterium D16-59]RKI57627.1 hypothetical protein D7V86_17260 [bacterium D16-51]
MSKRKFMNIFIGKRRGADSKAVGNAIFQGEVCVTAYLFLLFRCGENRNLVIELIYLEICKERENTFPTILKYNFSNMQ